MGSLDTSPVAFPFNVFVVALGIVTIAVPSVYAAVRSVEVVLGLSITYVIAFTLTIGLPLLVWARIVAICGQQ